MSMDLKQHYFNTMCQKIRIPLILLRLFEVINELRDVFINVPHSGLGKLSDAICHKSTPFFPITCYITRLFICICTKKMGGLLFCHKLM